MKKRNRKIRSAMAAALAVSMVAAPCSSALAASTSDEITQREIDNAALAREAAGQGMVLLENENHTLPLKTKKLALFGSGAVRTIKGGFGSGDPFNGGLSGGGSWDVDLNERYNIHIYNTFKKAGYDIVNSDMLDAYADAYDAQHKIEGNSTMNCFKFPEMEISDEELADASADSDTAIYVISRNAGEGTDRTLKGTKGTYNGESYDIGDYYLTDLERENLERVAASFKKTIVVLNVGGIMDTKFYNEINGLDAMLLMGQGGHTKVGKFINVQRVHAQHRAQKSGCRGARQAVDRLLLVRTHGSNYLRVFFPQALRRAGNCIVLFYPFPCCFSTVATGFTNRKHIPPATALATASICRAGRSSSWLPA